MGRLFPLLLLYSPAFMLSFGTFAREVSPLPPAGATDPGRRDQEWKAHIWKAVREKERLTACPMHGKWACYTILLVPEEIEAAYTRRPEGTLTVLQSIVERGSAREALTAAGYCYALAESPVFGALASTSPEKSLDEVNEVTGRTERAWLLQGVEDLMAKARRPASQAVPIRPRR